MIVFVLEYSHHHGRDFSAYATRELATEAAADLCDQFAGEMLATDGSTERIRTLHAEGKFTECIDAYHESREDESMDIHELDVIDGLHALAQPDDHARRWLTALDRCSICNEPAHASETDDRDRCARCALAAGEPHEVPHG